MSARADSLILLLGFRGAGKTTWGPCLAREFGLEFVDADATLEKRLGLSILDFVKAEGEARFRTEESAELKKLLEKKRAVVALGGGVVDSTEARRLLAGSPAWKIYLKAAPAVLWARLASDPRRLAIGGLDSVQKLTELLARRAPLYEELANTTVENDFPEAAAAFRALLPSLRLAFSQYSG